MSRAIDRYLKRHAEPASIQPPDAEPWDNVLVLPCYRESPSALDAFRDAFADAGRLLLVVVLNRPDSEADHNCNRPLRDAIRALPSFDEPPSPLYRLGSSTDLLLLDLDSDGPLAASEGVGLARKTGCDLALLWHVEGRITSPWINCTDADACLPPDYFSRLPRQRAAAISWPYCHGGGDTPAETDACERYELRLHHYVLGLDWAGSPYAFHTIGSCISVHGEHYAQVGGVPRRNGAEDFYLLNKLAKTGNIHRANGECLRLEARSSDRVPFGTGPAIREIADESDPNARPMYYHPDTFAALRALLHSVPQLRAADTTDLEAVLTANGCDSLLAGAAASALHAAGLAVALTHCRSHSTSDADFLRHFHQWFDGFRTLKFLHRLRDDGSPDLTLQGLAEARPAFWPPLSGDAALPGEWLRAARQHLGWHCRDRECW